jgi:hypothetical protein
MADIAKARAQYIAAGFDPSPKQNIDQMVAALKLALGRAGCEACGRVAFWKIDFIDDPVVREIPTMKSFGAAGF